MRTRIREITEGAGFDIGIDTAGSEFTIRQLVEAAKPGGTIVFVGYSANGTVTFPLDITLNKEITFKTVFRYRNVYPAAVAAVAAGKIDVSAVVTHRFDLDHIQEALTACIEDKANIVKGVIRVAE